MNDWVRFLLATMLVAMMFGHLSHAGEPKGLVLVADVHSDLPALTMQEVRKLYLGVAVTHSGQTVEPLVNMTDESLYEVFLQKVIFMSAATYQRQLTRRFLHALGRRPTVYRDRARLFDALSRSSYAVTYVMWEDEAERNPEVRVVKVLWDGRS